MDLSESLEDSSELKLKKDKKKQVDKNKLEEITIDDESDGKGKKKANPNGKAVKGGTKGDTKSKATGKTNPDGKSQKDVKKATGKSDEVEEGVVLEELDVIVVNSEDSTPSSSDENEDAFALLQSMSEDERQKLPFFERLPDEIIAHIYDNLTEEEIIKTGQVCKKFYELLNEDVVWESHAAAWKFVINSVSIGKKNVTGSMKEFYVTKYRENKGAEAREELRRLQELKNAKKKATEQALVKFMYYTFFRMHGTEIPVCICLLVWSVLLHLRADEFIVCSYHLVFLPLYVAFFNIFLSLFLGDVLNAKYGSNDRGLYDWRSRNLPSILAREFGPNTRIRNMFYATWLMGLLWLLLIAFAKDDSASENGGNFSTWWALIPLGVLVMIYASAWFTKRSFDGFEKFLFIMVILFPFSIFMWFVLFIWAKAEEQVTFNWYAAFSPWWIFGIIVFVPLSIALFLLFFNFVNGSERRVVMFVSGPVSIALSSLITWFALLCYNQEKYTRDLPIWPWTLVGVPLYVGQIGLIGCLMFAARKIR